MNYSKQQRAELHRVNRRWPDKLIDVPVCQWPARSGNMQAHINVLRSKTFLVQVVRELDWAVRLTINRTVQDKNCEWVGDITWDELMEVKRQAGFGNWLAIEFYPPDADVVNVANMRHLFLIEDGKLPKHWQRDSE